MIVFSICSLFTALLSLSIGNYVLYRGPKSNLTILFYLVSLCMFLWGGLEFGFRRAATYTTAEMWLHFCFLWPIAIAIGLHFVAAFTEQIEDCFNLLVCLVIYFPAILFSTYFLISAPENSRLIKTTWGWMFDLPEDNAVYALSYLWGIIVSVASIIMCIRYYLYVSGSQVKRHATNFLLCIILISVFGIVTAVIFPLLDMRFPQLITVGLLTACIMSGIAIWKNDLFVLTPVTAASGITSTIPDVLLLVNAENKITLANKAALNILGYVKNEIIGQPVDLVFGESSVLIENIKQKGTINDIKTVLTTKDQRTVSVSLAASVIKGLTDINPGIVFIARDITESLRSIARLKESEDKFRGIAERSFDLIFMVDKSGNVTYASPALERLFLYRPEDVMGQPFEKFVMASDARDMLDIYGRFNHGEEIGTQRLTLLKKDGSHAFVEFNLSRIYENGVHVGTQGIVRDVTDRKKFEEALIENKDKYKLIFENVNDGIVFMDSSGKIIEVNSKIKEIFGIGQKELDGKDFREFSHLFPPEDFGKIMKIFENILTKASSPSQVINLTRLDGSKATVEASAKLISKDTDIVGLLIVVKDITKRVKAEQENKILGEQLFRSQKMEALGTMASGVAHDFNNSLGSIILNAEVALEEAPPEGELRHSLKQVLKTGKRSKKLVHQILTFSRDKEVTRRPMNIAVIVKETLEMLKPMLPLSTEIHEKIDPHVLPVLADATQIQQLVMNLCSNGAHAMKDKGGKLIVSLENVHFDTPCSDILQGTSVGPGKFVRLTVQDSGKGIAPEIRDRIFDPFFTTKEQGEGTGLGLSVVHGIVASHEGGVALDSKSGKGTSFMIYFPTVENDVVKALGKNGPMPTGKETILFVDDEPDFIDISKRMLSRLGYQVQGVTSALEALDIFKSRHREFDLVITDLTMPNMTGIELSKELMRVRPDIPVIVCTGLTSSIDPQVIKKNGVRDYIVKPFVVREMAETVRRVLDESAN